MKTPKLVLNDDNVGMTVNPTSESPDKGLDAAPAKGWIVVNMKEDWKTMCPDSAPGAQTGSSPPKE